MFVGSGFGMDIKTLTNRYSPPKLKIYGVEISARDTQVAILNQTPATLAQGAAESLPFPDNFFDIIISCEVFEHVADAGTMLSEIERTARNGCQVFIGTPNGASLAYIHVYEWLFTLVTGKRFVKKKVTDNHYTSKEVMALVAQYTPSIKLTRRIFDMPFYFVCQMAPEPLHAVIIPMLVKLTNFTSQIPFFNRLFCDQAKYFFAVSKSGTGSASSPVETPFACPQCHVTLTSVEMGWRCVQCQTVFLVNDGLAQFLPFSGETVLRQAATLGKKSRAMEVKLIVRRFLVHFFNAGEFILWVLVVPLIFATYLVARIQK